MPTPRRARSLSVAAGNARRPATAQRLAVLAASLNAAQRRQATPARRRPTAERRAANVAALATSPVPRRRRNNARLRNELTQLRLERQEELNRLRRQLTRQHNAALARAVNQRQANVRSALLNQFANMSRQVNSRAVNRTRVQANTNSRAKFLNAINKVKNIIRLTGQSQEYLTLTNAIRNFSNTRGNNATLNAKANAIFRAYGALPGGAAALGPRTKLKVARKLQSLSKIYSNKHGNALYEAGLRYGTNRLPAGGIIRGIARRLA
jgi:hypothetical protein